MNFKALCRKTYHKAIENKLVEKLRSWLSRIIVWIKALLSRLKSCTAALIRHPYFTAPVFGWTLLGLSLLYLALASIFTPTLYNGTVSNSGSDKFQAITLPFVDEVPGEKLSYTFDFALIHHSYQTNILSIRSPNCITEVMINDTRLLPMETPGKDCNPQVGFNIALKDRLQDGINHLRIGFTEERRPFYGLNILSPTFPLPQRPWNILIPCIILALIGWPKRQWLWDRRAHPVTIMTGIVLWSVLVRLPYFFQTFHDIDEGTFLVMGREILQGYLPYVRLSDNKPPLLFFVFALFEFFSDQLPVIRLLGSIWIGFTSYIVYLTAKRINQPAAGLWAAVLTPIFLTLGARSTGDIMSEQIAALPMAGVLYFLLSPSCSRKDLINAGICIGLATMVRTNLIILAPACALFLWRSTPWPQTHRTYWPGFKNALRMGGYALISTLIPIAFVFFIYTVAGHFMLLVKSLILLPLYMNANNGLGLTSRWFWLESYAAMRDVTNNLYPSHASSRLMFDSGVIVTLWGIFYTRGPLRIAIVKTAVIAALTLMSLYISHNSFDHYFFQFGPPLALLAGFLAAHLLRNTGLVLLGAYFLTYIGLPIIGTADETYSRWVRYLPLQYDNFYKAARYIEQQGDARDQYIYSCNESLFYWMTHTKVPPVWYAHTDILSRIPELGKAMGQKHYEYKDMLTDIFAVNPVYIIGGPSHPCFETAPDELKNRYEIDKVFGIIGVYKQKKQPPLPESDE